MNKTPTFDRAQANILIELLGPDGRSGGTMSYPETAGFLFVVACSPELKNPREWLAVVLNNSTEDKSAADTNKILNGLMSLYNEVNRQVQDNDITLLPGCEYQNDPINNFDDDAPMHHWARGFVMGFSWLAKDWQQYVPDQLSEELRSHQMVLGCFASRELTEEYLREEVNNKDITLNKMAADMQSLIPDAMNAFATLGRSIQQVLSERQKPTTRTAPKTGRNEPCHCGSGKKFKKCCGMNLH